MTDRARGGVWFAAFGVIGLVHYVFHVDQYVTIAVAGTVLGYFLTAEAAWFRRWRPWVPARDLGHALVIAGLFALTYEGYLRRTAIEEVVKGVAPHYITYPLPEEVAAEVKYLGELRMLREDVEINVRLTQEGPNPDSLTEEVRLSYTMANYSTDSLPFKHVAGVTGGPRRAGQLLEAAASGQDLSGSEYDVRIEKRDFAREVKIPPNSLKPDNRFYLRARYPRRADDGDVIFSRDPMKNVTVIVEAPPDIHVDVVFGHRKFQGTRVSPTRWRLQGVQLPWSVVYLEWYRIRPSG